MKSKDDIAKISANENGNQGDMADAHKMEFDKIITDIAADFEIFIDEKPELKKELVSAGLYHEETSEE